jgi:hypothetical protein
MFRVICSVMSVSCMAIFASSSAFAQSGDFCAPLTSIDCGTWPAQAQMIGVVVKALPVQKGCIVTVKPSAWQDHPLCPMYMTNSTVSYGVCGACPEEGKEVSGVLMSNGQGHTVLD